jgi:adenine-specific DNA-methyltransferase
MATRITTKSVETSSTTRPSARTSRRPSSSPLLQQEQTAPKQIRYPRNTDLDPQLVWRGKDEQDWSDLVVTRRRSTSRKRCTPRC